MLFCAGGGWKGHDFLAREKKKILTEPFIPVEYGQYTNPSGHKLSVVNLPSTNGIAINPSHSRLHSQVYEIDTFAFE